MINQVPIAKDLYIVAGSRGSGKSTFINWCQRERREESLPPELQVIANYGEPIYFMDFANFAGKTNQELLVHVDIFTPFSELLLMPSETSICDSLSLKTFWDYPNTPLLTQAENIFVFTIRTKREVVFRRWLERCVEQKSKLVRTLLTQIYSDVYGERPFQQLYAVWDEFTSALPNVKRWDVFETKPDGYRIEPDFL